MNSKSKAWITQRPNKHNPNPPLDFKAEIDRKANQFIIAELQPQYVQNAIPPLNQNNNYITRIYTKWHGRYFYFCAEYTCPSPQAYSPTFESKFARLEYTVPLRFNLSYLRHTRTWWELGTDLSFEECCALIKDGGSFYP